MPKHSSCSRNCGGRRGQAALEYLVTYGWGFVAIIVIAGALAYFGFFSPSRYLPERCSFGSQLQCVDFQLRPDGMIRLQFRNNFGDGIQVVSFYTFSEAATSTMAVQNPVITKGNLSSIFNVTPSLTENVNQLVAGDRVSIPVIVTFRRAGGGTPPLHNVTGEIFATVR